MNFQPNEIIKDKRGENRWKVTGVIQQKRFYTIFQVEDQTPNLERCLYMMTLNYNALPGKNHLFEISDLRHSFHQMAKILCMNYTFLSEPADLLRFTNTQDKMNDSLRADEPALVFAQPQGFPLPRQTRIEKKDTWYKVQSAVRTCLKTLSALHRNKVVIRRPTYNWMRRSAENVKKKYRPDMKRLTGKILDGMDSAILVCLNELALLEENRNKQVILYTADFPLWHILKRVKERHKSWFARNTEAVCALWA